MSQVMTNVLHAIWKSEALAEHPLNETLSLFYSRIPTWRSGLEKISSYSIDDLLRRAADMPEVEWLVVHGEGNLYHSQNRILDEVEAFIRTLDARILVAGHLINRPDFYCGLHEQFLIVNIKAFDRIGRPAFGDYGQHEAVLANYEAGPSVHDDYTPKFLNPASGEKLYRVKTCGWSLVAAAMKNGLRAVNLPDSVRNEKIYLYPKDETARLLKNIDALFDIMPTKNISQNRALTYLLLKKLGISDYSWPNGMALYNERRTTVFAYNTETLVPDYQWIQKNGGELGGFIGTCAGFLDIANLKHFGFNERTKLVYYDMNPDSIRFKKHLLDHFNGDLEMLPKFIHEFKQNNPHVIISDNSADEGLLELRNEFPSKEEFQILWKRMQSLERHFVQCNLLDDNRRLFELGLDSKQRTLFLISDIFTGMNELTHGTHNLQKVFLRLLDDLKSWEKLIIQGTDYRFDPVLDYIPALCRRYFEVENDRHV